MNILLIVSVNLAFAFALWAICEYKAYRIISLTEYILWFIILYVGTVFCITTLFQSFLR